jgi:hypothetical protein
VKAARSAEGTASALSTGVATAPDGAALDSGWEAGTDEVAGVDAAVDDAAEGDASVLVQAVTSRAARMLTMRAGRGTDDHMGGPPLGTGRNVNRVGDAPPQRHVTHRLT